MKKTLAAAVCLFCFALSSCIPPARAEAVTLSELKQQTPERLQMTVVTDAGETVVVDAPILLPEGDVMPLVLVKRATFNTQELYEIYPQPKGRDRYFYGASESSAREECDHLSIYQEEKQYKIYGKIDYSKRYTLPKGSLPPENDMTVEEIMQFMYENIERFNCDTTLDIRVEEATAMSGLCEMKKHKVTDGNGVSWTEIIPNPDKPLKKGTRGIWSLKLAQYMYDIKIMDSYLPYGSHMTPTNPNEWYYPIFLYADYLDEKNYDMGVFAMKEIQVLNSDMLLLSYDDLVNHLTQRIKQGKLKSVYELRLAYSVRIVKGESYVAEDGFSFNPDTRFVLVPEWRILGFDEKDATTAKSVGYDQPSKEAILDPANHSRYSIPYELRMDASTGNFILDYDAIEFTLGE